MGKLSALPQETNFSLSDFLLKIKNAGSGDTLVSLANFLTDIFSGQLQTLANAGTAGGTMYYINLGGIKLLWGITSGLSYSGATAQYTITLPGSFFSTLQGYTIGQGNAGGTYGQKVEFQTSYPTTSAANIQINNNGSGSSSITCSYFLIGS